MKAHLVDELHEAFDGSFMKPEIQDGTWWVVDGPDGMWVFPLRYFTRDDLMSEYPKAEIETQRGYGSRLSAPGYLDCTDWGLHPTEDAAAEELLEIYGEG